MRQSAQPIVMALAKQPENVDPKIPKTLERLNEATETNGKNISFYAESFFTALQNTISKVSEEAIKRCNDDKAAMGFKVIIKTIKGTVLIGDFAVNFIISVSNDLLDLAKKDPEHFGWITRVVDRIREWKKKNEP